MRVVMPLGGTDWGRSGIGTYVREVVPRLARRLNERGDELAVVGNDRDLSAYEEVSSGAVAIPIEEAFDAPGASAAWYLTRMGSWAKRVGGDVLLLPAANRRLTLYSPIPVVSVVHDLAQLHIPGKYDALRMFYLRQVVMRALRGASELVTVSDATRQDLASAMGIRPGRIRVVLNGVDYERFLPPDGDDARVSNAREVHGLEGEYVLYASRLEHPGKNHLRLIEAFARSSACRGKTLALAGKDWGAEEMIKRTIARYGLEDRVKLLGFVADEVLPGLVAGASVVVMVGLREGFGLPALEALAAGRTVCVSSTGALPEVVGDLGVIVDPMSVDAIADGLSRALTDEALRARCSAEGPTWASGLGWDNTASGLFDACHAASGRSSNMLSSLPLVGRVFRGGRR